MGIVKDKEEMDADLLAMLSAFDDNDTFDPGSTCGNKNYVRK